MLKQRIITGLLMVAIFLCTLLVLPPLIFVLLVTIALLVSAWEWANIVHLHRPIHRLTYVLTTGVLLLIVAVVMDISSQLTMNIEVIRYLLLISVSWWAVCLLWIQSYPTSAILWGRRWVLALMGWLILIPTWLALLYLRGLANGDWLILLVVSIVVTADVGAYFSGRMLGKHKLAPKVSPNKSWEGLAGGLLACLLLAVLAASIIDFYEWIQLSVVVILVALASVVGDLMESMVKRHRGIKDSSNILPGHGGVLDRIDSLNRCGSCVFACHYFL